MHLDDSLLDALGRIDPARWAAAQATRAPIGRCEQHRSQAIAGEVDAGVRGRRFYTVLCLGDATHDAVVPVDRQVRDPLSVPIYGVWSAEAEQAAREREAAMLGERDVA